MPVISLNIKIDIDIKNTEEDECDGNFFEFFDKLGNLVKGLQRKPGKDQYVYNENDPVYLQD